MSLLDPLFAVAPVTLGNYSMLPHPNGWIISDPHDCNPKFFLHTWIRRLCRVSVPWTSWEIFNEVMEKIEDVNSHLFCLQIHWLRSASCLCSSFSAAKVSWQQSRDSHGSLMLSEGTFSSPQVTAGDCLKTFLAQLPFLAHSYTLSWVPAL